MEAHASSVSDSSHLSANPKFREWGHWIVMNIRDHDVSTGTPLWDYIGAAPPQGTQQVVRGDYKVMKG